jgi:hypothetical protein
LVGWDERRMGYVLAETERVRELGDNGKWREVHRCAAYLYTDTGFISFTWASKASEQALSLSLASCSYST